MDWNELMPGASAYKVGETTMIEQSAVRRLLRKTGQSGQAAMTFKELEESLGFPYHCVAHKFSARELEDLHTDMRKWPTKTPLLITFGEHVEETGSVALVFPWHGFGGLHVLTCDGLLPNKPGSAGSFWRVKDIYYLLEPIDSFAERMGGPDEW